MDDPTEADAPQGKRAGRFAAAEGLIDNAGAALTVGVALVLIFIVALVALLGTEGQDRVTVATAAFTAIGTIAGAYFGIRMGADGKQGAERAREESERVVEQVALRVGAEPVTAAREEVRRQARDRPPRN